MVFGTMLLMSVISTGAGVWSEAHSATTRDVALMEGKEVRFGADASALWATLTTQTSNGSVNAMHDSLAPLTGGVTLTNMLINSIWGGIGCGLSQFLVYLLLAVFLAGLMTGRTPELFGRKVEAPEVRLLAVLILLQPIVVLGFTAITLFFPSITGNSNPGFHGISQVFYEYTSAFANNGSGFEGLGDATYWWNLSCALVLALGRYPRADRAAGDRRPDGEEEADPGEQRHAARGDADLRADPGRGDRDPDRSAVHSGAGTGPGGGTPDACRDRAEVNMIVNDTINSLPILATPAATPRPRSMRPACVPR